MSVQVRYHYGCLLLVSILLLFSKKHIILIFIQLTRKLIKPNWVMNFNIGFIFFYIVKKPENYDISNNLKKLDYTI